MAVPTETVTTENVVVSTAVDKELNLNTLRVDLSRGLRPRPVPWIGLPDDRPHTASLVFRSGEVVTTGAKSEADAHDALEILFGELDGLGLTVPDTPTVTGQHTVSTADLGRSLNLNAITVRFGLERIKSEPEQFPGLVYRMDEQSVVVLLFGSGKLVITGATRLAEAEHAVERIHSRLDEVSLLD